mgnify:CR=1 FL=1
MKGDLERVLYPSQTCPCKGCLVSYADSHQLQKYSLCLTVWRKVSMLLVEHPLPALPISEGDAEASTMSTMEKRMTEKILKNPMAAVE